MSDGIPKRPEKRHYKRLELDLPVTIEVAGQAVDATAENVSCGGMFLPQVNYEFKTNDPITVFVNLPQSCKPVKLAARVSRVQKNVTGEQSVALQFSGLYDDNRMEIDRFVKWKLLN